MRMLEGWQVYDDEVAIVGMKSVARLVFGMSTGLCPGNGGKGPVVAISLVLVSGREFLCPTIAAP